MECILYLCLISGVWMLSFSARQTFAADEHRLRLSDIPPRIRVVLRRAAPPGFWVRTVRVTMEGGAPAYWFAGSTPGHRDAAMAVLDCGQAVALPPGSSRRIEERGFASTQALSHTLLPVPGRGVFATRTGCVVEREPDVQWLSR